MKKRLERLANDYSRDIADLGQLVSIMMKNGQSNPSVNAMLAEKKNALANIVMILTLEGLASSNGRCENGKRDGF